MGRNGTFQQLVKRIRGFWVIVGLGLVVFALLLVTLGLTHDKQQAPAKAAARPTAFFSNADHAISFSYYSDDLVNRSLSSEDAANNIIGRLGGAQEPMLVTVQYEKDLSKVSGLLRREPIDIVLENSAKVLPQKYPGYRMVKQREFSQAGHQAAEIIFTYKGNNQRSVKMRFDVFLRNKDEAIYLNAQSPESNFARLNQQVFELSFKSFKFTD